MEGDKDHELPHCQTEEKPSSTMDSCPPILENLQVLFSYDPYSTKLPKIHLHLHDLFFNYS